ncbi:Uncharacterised protein [Mycobacteroides abscessus subsp. abscessus]|nr:Uncharacterised protein [Mycobacteroides abscessus subsp. abscessus]
MACVGQAVMQRRQLPQWGVRASSAGSGKSVRISPRKNQLPSRDNSKVCLPRHPMPALRASSTSIKGAESVNAR